MLWGEGRDVNVHVDDHSVQDDTRFASPCRRPYHPPHMAAASVELIGRKAIGLLESFGVFCTFVGRTFAWLFTGGLSLKNIKLLFPQMYEVGVRSVPVVGVTGGFIGMV